MNKNKLLQIGAWSLAGVVLCGALVYYNFIDTPPKGNTVQDVCPDFTVGKFGVENGKFVYTDETFTLSDYKGKVVVLNFWATWCEPCKKEIPHFNEFYEEYSDSVEVVILNGETSRTAEQFADKILNYPDEQGNYENYYSKWTDFTCTFARYENDNNVFNMFDVSGSLPVTVVVDKLGIIRYIGEVSLSYEELESIVLPWTEK